MSSHLGWYLAIEGIPYLFCSDSWTITGTHSDLGDLDDYTGLPCIDSSNPISSMKYSVDPIKREADVGMMTLRLIDYHDGSSTHGILTDVFSPRKRAPANTTFLDEIISHGKTLDGSQTVTANINVESTTYFYIEKETFKTTGTSGKDYTGVSRAQCQSVAASHYGGVIDELGYTPKIYHTPPYWLDRLCSLYRVIDNDVANAVRIWVGPLVDMSPSGANGWVLKIGTVLRYLDTTVFRAAPHTVGVPGSEHGLWQEDGKARIYGYATSAAVTDPTVPISASMTKVRDGLTVTSVGANARMQTRCTDLIEPDNFWCSQFMLRWITSANGNAYEWVGIDTFDKATNEITHGQMDYDVAVGDTFELYRHNFLPPTHMMGAFAALVGSTLCAVANVSAIVGTANSHYGFDITVPARIRDGRKHGHFYVIHPIETEWKTSDNDTENAGAELREVFSNYRTSASDIDVSTNNLTYSLGEFLADIRRSHNYQYGSIDHTIKHPLEWLCELWCSTGDDNRNNSTYDVLPEHHGAAIREDLIDHATIAAMAPSLTPLGGADRTGIARFMYVEPTKLKDIVYEMCMLYGLYPTIDSYGRLVLKRLAQHNAYEDPDWTIDESDIIGMPNTTYDLVNISPIVNVKHERDLTTGEYDKVLSLVDGEAMKFHPNAKSEGVELSTYSHVRSKMWFNCFERELTAAIRRTLDRTAQPQVYVTIEVPFDRTDDTALGRSVRPGDTVKLTCDNVIMPDNTRGASNDWFEVRDSDLNPMRQTAKLKLFWLGWYEQNFGRFSFSAKVTAWNAGTKTITVNTDLLPGSTDVTDYVSASDTLKIHWCAASRKSGGVGYNTSEDITVDSVTASTIVITAAPTYAPVSGDWVQFADYDDADTDQKKLAYMAAEGSDSISGDEHCDSEDPYVLV